MSPVTEQAIIMLSSHFYESRAMVVQVASLLDTAIIAGQQARETT